MPVEPDVKIKFPLSIKVPLVFIGLIAFFAVLYIGSSIIVPLVFATIIAIVLHPVVNRVTRLKMNRIVAIALVLAMAILLIAVFSGLIIRQVNHFGESWPILMEKLSGLMDKFISDAASFYEIKPEKIYGWFAVAKGQLLDKSSAAIGETLAIISNGLVALFLIPVYVFMILFYQPLLREFIHKLFSEDKKEKVGKIVSQIKVVLQQYLIGLIIEFVLVAMLNVVALLILGIDYAILLGILGALLNIIPYLGGIISVGLFMLVALITKDPIYVVYVAAAYTVIQFVDNNYIVPKIVASKVKINALFSIIVVLAGNALWGISGMFLSIPILAIAKLIFDHIASLKPWGFLLGDTMPSLLKIKPIFKKADAKATREDV